MLDNRVESIMTEHVIGLFEEITVKPYFIQKIKSFVVTTIFDLEFQKFTSKCRIACSIEWQGQKKCSKYLNCRDSCHLAYMGEHTVYFSIPSVPQYFPFGSSFFFDTIVSTFSLIE